MADHLEYDGQTLTWFPSKQRFKASSGFAYPGLANYQRPEDQCARPTKDDPNRAGPIPEGRYFLRLKQDPKVYAVERSSGTCELQPSSLIQTIPRYVNPALGLD